MRRAHVMYILVLLLNARAAVVAVVDVHNEVPGINIITGDHSNQDLRSA